MEQVLMEWGLDAYLATRIAGMAHELERLDLEEQKRQLILHKSQFGRTLKYINNLADVAITKANDEFRKKYNTSNSTFNREYGVELARMRPSLTCFDYDFLMNCRRNVDSVSINLRGMDERTLQNRAERKPFNLIGRRRL